MAREVVSRFQVAEAELYQPCAPCRDARSVFRELCDFFLSKSMSLAEIGRGVGIVNGAALRQNSKRPAVKMKHDIRLLEQVERLRTNLE
jgi:hypothetical protein